jgi:hypothetical protein
MRYARVYDSIVLKDFHDAIGKKIKYRRQITEIMFPGTEAARDKSLKNHRPPI